MAHFSGFNHDKKKQNHMSKCFYLMNLIKSKNHKSWEKLQVQFKDLKVEGSYDFYQLLVEEYKKISSPKKANLKLVKEPKKKPAKKVAKKKVAKKPAKKVAKKKVAKKPAKKVAKKKVAKKPAKKVAKKKVAKKAA